MPMHDSIDSRGEKWVDSLNLKLGKNGWACRARGSLFPFGLTRVTKASRSHLRGSKLLTNNV